jgi:hypothetical protein
MTDKTLLYFMWSDDADPIPFRINELGEWTVTGDALLYMMRVTIGSAEQDVLTNLDVVQAVGDLLKVYQPTTDDAVLPDWFPKSFDIVDEDGNVLEGADARLCDCGHIVSLHQTGDGAWTGFCHAARGDDDKCECERPTIDGKEVS